jgi:ZIP family zinc transporter
MGQMIFLSAAAGIIGTGLGGLLAAILLNRPSENMICWLLSFSAGVMVSITCFGLVPEAFKLAGVTVSVLGLLGGIVVVMALNHVIDRITITRKGNLKLHHAHAELFHESPIINDNKRMLRSGVLMLFAIALHNIPEGMAIGAGGSHNFRLGALLAFMIAMHNIPEGMAIAAPMLAGGVNKGKVVFLTVLAGATTLFGGLIGIAIGSISDLAIALSLSAAGGAMLYIVFGEIIPQSIVMTKNRTASIVALFGIITGLIVTQI